MPLSDSQKDKLNLVSLLLILAVWMTGVLLLLSSGCGMNVHKPTVYKGKASATKPYVEMGEMYTQIFGCDYKTNECSHNVYCPADSQPN